MSKYNDIDWTRKGNQEVREENSSRVAHCARKFPKGHWSFRGPGNEEKWYATLAYKPNGACNRAGEQMMISFAVSGHVVFRGTSLLSRGALKREERRRHITMWNLELQSCFAVNQLSIFGAVADWCQEFVQRADAHASEAR